ncbi:hypothetical protein MKJ04_03155 [Pontibacter sp. E15-1]|nr:hypothetical protein [Pontibacter sp. E15-1]MCJ8163824.1 hypothetical protein [Pontibacter sp. E15-1]
MALTTVKDAAVPLNATEDTALRLVPVIVTVMPILPEVGLTLVMVGVNSSAVPVRANVYGFSSASLFAMLNVAVLLPKLLGLKEISKLVDAPAATVPSVVDSFTTNWAASVPDITTFGFPVSVKLSVPLFSTTKLLGLPVPTPTVPNAKLPPELMLVLFCFILISGPGTASVNVMSSSNIDAVNLVVI